MTKTLPTLLAWLFLALFHPVLSAAQTTETTIFLQGDIITIGGSGATATNGVITITAPGTYSLSGFLDDGQIRVDAGDDDEIVLQLNNTDISSSTTAPLFVVNCDKTTLLLVEGTNNRLTDADVYLDLGDKDEPNAAIFSKDDLVIEGSGTLIVQANFNHGIASNDDLKIKDGATIVVDAVNDGLKGKDSIEVREEVSILVLAGGDGLQSSKGSVLVGPSTTLDLTAARDGIQAHTDVTILGGDIMVLAGGGSGTNVTDKSTKGIKADGDILIEAGTFLVNASDDAIHSNQKVTIQGGTFTLASGDDGIHGDDMVTIQDGSINVTESYEGIAGNLVSIHGGTIHIVSSDDGISVGKVPPGQGPPGPPGGMGNNSNFQAALQSGIPLTECPFPGGRVPPGFAPGGGPPGSGPNATSVDNYLLEITGGTLWIDSFGDGIDSNGHANITGGTILINGPTIFANGALDADGDFRVSGGLIVAVGSHGMAQTPGSKVSTQLSVRYDFAEKQPTGTMIHVESANGTHIFTYLPTKEFQSVVFSSPDLVLGVTYNIYIGGSVLGSSETPLLINGLLATTRDGTSYTTGEMVGSVTTTGIVTNESNGFDKIFAILFGACEMGPPGGGGPMQGGGPPSQGGNPPPVLSENESEGGGASVNKQGVDNGSLEATELEKEKASATSGAKRLSLVGTTMVLVMGLFLL